MPAKKTLKKLTNEQSWWNTLPGTITKVTGLLIAISGLIGALMGVVNGFKDLPFLHPSALCRDYGQGLQTALIRIGTQDLESFEIADVTSLGKTRLLNITEDGIKIVGNVQFSYSEVKDEFEIIAVVDNNCRSRLDSPVYKKSGEEFSITLNKNYTITFSYKEKSIFATAKYDN